MTILEARNKGCPKRIADKLEGAGVASFSTPHDLNNINWYKIERDVDRMMKGLFYTANKDDDDAEIEDDEIETRFEILDL